MASEYLDKRREERNQIAHWDIDIASVDEFVRKNIVGEELPPMDADPVDVERNEQNQITVSTEWLARILKQLHSWDAEKI